MSTVIKTMITINYTASQVAQGLRIHLQCRRHRFDPSIRKIPWRRAWQPLQYSRLENSMDRGAWWATVHGVAGEMTWKLKQQLCDYI